jgi:hypothetical protein
MSEKELPASVIISDNVLFQNIGTECVLLNMETEQYFGLDELAARYWQIFSENGDIKEACETIKAEYQVDEATLINDLLLFLEKLRNEKLVIIEE